jgi:hypothetical protein
VITENSVYIVSGRIQKKTIRWKIDTP